jgi:hypothetical protein
MFFFLFLLYIHSEFYILAYTWYPPVCFAERTSFFEVLSFILNKLICTQEKKKSIDTDNYSMRVYRMSFICFIYRYILPI